jgi:hypothetical protein
MFATQLELDLLVEAQLDLTAAPAPVVPVAAPVVEAAAAPATTAQMVAAVAAEEGWTASPYCSEAHPRYIRGEEELIVDFTAAGRVNWAGHLFGDVRGADVPRKSRNKLAAVLAILTAGDRA